MIELKVNQRSLRYGLEYSIKTATPTDVYKEGPYLELAEGKMSERGLSVTGFVGDIAEEQTLRDFVDFVLSIEDQIDCLINNACLTNGGILSNCSYEDFLYVQRVGVAAPYFLALSFKDYFSGAGAIVNISSTRAFQSQANT